MHMYCMNQQIKLSSFSSLWSFSKIMPSFKKIIQDQLTAKEPLSIEDVEAVFWSVKHHAVILLSGNIPGCPSVGVAKQTVNNTNKKYFVLKSPAFIYWDMKHVIIWRRIKAANIQVHGLTAGYRHWCKSSSCEVHTCLAAKHCCTYSLLSKGHTSACDTDIALS